MTYLLLIFLLGVTTPIRTVANSRLRQSVVYPLVASLVSFSVGTTYLAIATVIQCDPFVIAAETFSNLLDRLYGALSRHSLTGKNLFFLFQGAAPDRWMIEAGEYSIRIFAQLYGLNYMGMATTDARAKELAQRL